MFLLFVVNELLFIFVCLYVLSIYIYMADFACMKKKGDFSCFFFCENEGEKGEKSRQGGEVGRVG